MSEYLHSTADKAADTASTAILEKVKNIRRKYTTLKACMAKVYKQMSDNSRRLRELQIDGAGEQVSHNIEALLNDVKGGAVETILTDPRRKESAAMIEARV
eukprot:COSAG01_NODE_41197_length_454_cov_1.571831_1_plen_100_part_10